MICTKITQFASMQCFKFIFYSKISETIFRKDSRRMRCLQERFSISGLVSNFPDRWNESSGSNGSSDTDASSLYSGTLDSPVDTLPTTIYDQFKFPFVIHVSQGWSIFRDSLSSHQKTSKKGICFFEECWIEMVVFILYFLAR